MKEAKVRRILEQHGSEIKKLQRKINHCLDLPESDPTPTAFDKVWEEEETPIACTDYKGIYRAGWRARGKAIRDKVHEQYTVHCSNDYTVSHLLAFIDKTECK